MIYSTQSSYIKHSEGFSCMHVKEHWYVADGGSLCTIVYLLQHHGTKHTNLIIMMMMLYKYKHSKGCMYIVAHLKSSEK